MQEVGGNAAGLAKGRQALGLRAELLFQLLVLPRHGNRHSVVEQRPKTIDRTHLLGRLASQVCQGRRCGWYMTRFRVSGFGFRVSGFGFRVSGLDGAGGR